jgi:uncharacterized hydrophobic protein (TIGR00271 family)
MLHLRIHAPASLAAAALECLQGDPAVSAIGIVRGGSVQPIGDLITADVAREGANEIIDRLRDLGIPAEGALHVDPAPTWISRPGYDAERRTPGSSADTVVWADVVQQSYNDSELNWTYLSFMTLATLLASVAIVLDSQVLVIGAMILGPDFGPVAALGVALVRHRWSLLGLAGRTLVLGFTSAIVVTTLLALLARGLGWITEWDVTRPRPGTGFIYTPDKWSFIVALIAAAAGVLSVTSAKTHGLSGVFVSVTTVPAAGNIALGIALGAWHEVWGSTLQLAVNLSGMAAAGWLTLAIQRSLWSRVSIRRRRPRPFLDDESPSL